MTEREPLVALVGYQWGDSTSAELLHEELAMRGLTVLHDKCSFAVGTRLDSAMADAVARCDAYVPYLTPNSLYEGGEAGSARPALDDEFIPACRRRRLSAGAGERPPKPVIAVVTHGLGDPHTAAAERVRAATGEDVGTLWSVAVDQADDELTQVDAARVADAVIDAVLPVSGDALGASVPITVVSRGTGQPPRFLTVDVTSSLGGRDRRPGEPVDWQRYLDAVRSLERALSRWTESRVLDLVMKGHTTAAVAFGRVFNQASGWHHVVESRSGPTELAVAGAHDHITVASEAYRRGGPLLIDVDLIGHQVADLANESSRHLPPPAGRVHIVAGQELLGRDLTANEIGTAAATAALEVRRMAAACRPDAIHLFVAAPAAFSVLLGHQLTALEAELVLYERGPDGYEAVLTVPSTVP
ncbi:MAG: SAVED domain-containing protein [Chloroflexota bacterium]